MRQTSNTSNEFHEFPPLPGSDMHGIQDVNHACNKLIIGQPSGGCTSVRDCLYLSLSARVGMKSPFSSSPEIGSWCKGAGTHRLHSLMSMCSAAAQAPRMHDHMAKEGVWRRAHVK